jgi:hypothetical protein
MKVGTGEESPEFGSELRQLPKNAGNIRLASVAVSVSSEK